MRAIIVMLCFAFTSAIKLINIARFEPTDHIILLRVIDVPSLTSCACLCFNHSICRTAMYSGEIRQCVLFFAPLAQGKLSLATTNEMNSVLSFSNKTLPAPLNMTSTNETIYGIWNTSAGQDSYPSSAGLSVSNYAPDQGPTEAFDSNITTKCVHFGACNATVGFSMTECGERTGFYLTPQQGLSLLLGFRFGTANSFPTRDPAMITIEGSNALTSELTRGSSWTVIYNGTSGLDVDPGRYAWGVTQWLVNNTVWYSNYRMLVVSKRSTGQFVQYAEVQLFGYGLMR